MEKYFIDRLENLNVELACANDTLEIFDRTIGESDEILKIYDILIGDVLYSLWSHYSRISKSLDEVVNEMYIYVNVNKNK